MAETKVTETKTTRTKTKTKTKTKTTKTKKAQNPEFFWGTGRRKSAVARVKIQRKKGDKGKILVNRQEPEEYFSKERDRMEILKPLKDTKTMEEYDIHCFVKGGGFTGQSGAILMGIARALLKIDPDQEEILRKKNHLTRDARVKERKKYGLRGARRSFQFSKR